MKSKQGSSKEKMEQLEKIVNILEHTIEELKFEKKNNPFKLLGIPVTFELLTTLGIAIGTGLGAAIQYLLATGKVSQKSD